MSNTWDEKADLLSALRSMDHNEDYWRFLIRDVWRLDRVPVRIVDVGCGYGWAGLFILPMLAIGSEYNGLDRSQTLLAKGRSSSRQLIAPRPLSRAMQPRSRLMTTSSTLQLRTPS